MHNLISTASAPEAEGRSPGASSSQALGLGKGAVRWHLVEALAKSHMLQHLTGSVVRLETQRQVSCLKGQNRSL